MKIVDNLQVTVSNVHIRYEDGLFSWSPYALGITLKGLDLHTTNERWEPHFLDRTVPENREKPVRKRLKLKDFTIYLDAQAKRIPEGEDEDIIAALRGLIPGASEDGLRSWALVKPINFVVRVTGEKGGQRAEMEIEKVEVQLKKRQFAHMARMAEVGEEFKARCVATPQEKFRVFLPEARMGDADFKGNRRQLTRDWWGFAIKSVLATIKYQKGSARVFEFGATRLAALEKQFDALLLKKLKKKEIRHLLPADQKALRRIIYIIEGAQLNEWAERVVRLYHEDQVKRRDKLKGVKNLFGGFFGGGAKKQPPKQEESKKEEPEDDLERLLS